MQVNNTFNHNEFNANKHTWRTTLIRAITSININLINTINILYQIHKYQHFAYFGSIIWTLHCSYLSIITTCAWFFMFHSISSVNSNSPNTFQIGIEFPFFIIAETLDGYIHTRRFELIFSWLWPIKIFSDIRLEPIKSYMIARYCYYYLNYEQEECL